jgi:hypothetical protein
MRRIDPNEAKYRRFRSHIPETDTVYGDLERRRFTVVNFEPPIAETRYQHGTPQDISGRNFVPKRDLTR